MRRGDALAQDVPIHELGPDRLLRRHAQRRRRAGAGPAARATGAWLSLAYIRHSREFDPRREELAQHDAVRRLEQGALWLQDPDIPKHVVFSGSTGEGLEQLAESEQASVIVFGSDYRTSPGRAEPGTSANGCSGAGRLRSRWRRPGCGASAMPQIASIAVAPGGDSAAEQTAEALAASSGRAIVELGGAPVDLIVVGSQPGAPSGRITLSGSTRTMLKARREVRCSWCLRACP